MPALFDARRVPIGCLGTAARPCPDHEAQIVEDMVKGAMDTIVRLGEVEAGWLRDRYGFSIEQILAHSTDAIREARRRLAYHPIMTGIRDQGSGIRGQDSGKAHG